jgi:hypothetical protein
MIRVDEWMLIKILRSRDDLGFLLKFKTPNQSHKLKWVHALEPTKPFVRDKS